MSEGHPAEAYPQHPYTYANYYRYHAEVQQHHYEPRPQHPREEDFQQDKTEDDDEEKADEEEKEEEEKKSELVTKKEVKSPDNLRRISGSGGSDKENHENEARRLADSIVVEEAVETDPVIIAQNELIAKSTPKTDLEIALSGALERKKAHADRLTKEILKLKQFISKRKQTYKRKRKDDGAPTRALSAYNIFIQERFAQLAKENEKALKSDDTDAELKRVPPSSLVASTGSEWNDLSAEEKMKYEEK
jgi:CHAT domain-containing protein